MKLQAAVRDIRVICGLACLPGTYDEWQVDRRRYIARDLDVVVSAD